MGKEQGKFSLPEGFLSGYMTIGTTCMDQRPDHIRATGQLRGQTMGSGDVTELRILSTQRA